MRKDKDSVEAAERIAKVCNRGEQMVKDAAFAASSKMPQMLAHFESAPAKAAALEHHAVHLGIAAQMMYNILPQATQMVEDLTEIMGNPKSAEIMTQLWLAKIFMDIEKSLQQYEQ